MAKRLSVRKALKVAHTTGTQVDIELKSGKTLEGVIVEKLWDTSFHV